VDKIEGMVGFSFHFFSLEFVILIDSFPDILESSGFGPFLQDDGLALGFHLFGKQLILLLFELIMELLFESLLLLFFENLPSLILVHPLPVVRLDPVPVEFRLASFLNKLVKLLCSMCKNRSQSHTRYG
jgi:hypothetical protein